jgi:hypothetical protein
MTIGIADVATDLVLVLLGRLAPTPPRTITLAAAHTGLFIAPNPLPVMSPLPSCAPLEVDIDPRPRTPS